MYMDIELHYNTKETTKVTLAKVIVTQLLQPRLLFKLQLMSNSHQLFNLKQSVL